MLSKFHVIGVVSNPVRYASRYRLCREFVERMKSYPVTFHLAEVAFGLRPFEMTHSNQPNHYQFRSSCEIWQKESMINTVISRLPHDWQYVAWVDTDISFLRHDVFEEAWHALQHYSVIQLFSDCVDLGPKQQIIQTHKGFCYIYSHNRKVRSKYEFAHPGFAWAATRKAIHDLGGLLETPLGAADHHMALALVGKAHLSLPGHIHENYRSLVMNWQTRAEAYVKRNIGYVPGTIYHYWHGKKKDRKYVERWDILKGFDPLLDTRKDWQGLLELTDRNIVLRDDIRDYLRNRNEDSTDLE